MMALPPTWSLTIRPAASIAMLLIKAFRQYLEANNMTANWDEVEKVSTENLVNTLSQLAPYPAAEKQALLEAPDLKSRADMLIALTELALAKQDRGKQGPAMTSPNATQNCSNCLVCPVTKTRLVYDAEEAGADQHAQQVSPIPFVMAFPSCLPKRRGIINA